MNYWSVHLEQPASHPSPPFGWLKAFAWALLERIESFPTSRQRDGCNVRARIIQEEMSFVNIHDKIFLRGGV